ncbi:MAG: PrsW family glutamic-type intramembrane protease [Dehalococcoidia bacterium]|nr:PrsW family glutamic-type intramembrane protease [Dehalococcoidia bacterium]
MIDYMVGYFESFFQNPSGSVTHLAMAIGLAIGFGGVWLTAYWPPLFRKPRLWAVLVGSAFLTPAAICFIQIPLQIWTGQALIHFWSNETLMRWIPLAAIPSILLTGLVQEGAKLVPVVVYWWRSGKNIDPKLGLAIGAVAGAGFAILEAQWVHNQMFASGWTWGWVQTYGFAALFGFWERFFTVAAHIGFSALAGYGLAKGWGWQFYLVASGLHGLLNYGTVLWQAGLLADLHVEIYIAVLGALVTAWALWLRWRKTTAEPGPEPEAEAETETEAEVSTP